MPDSADDLGALGVNHVDTAALGCSSPRSANELVNSSLTPYPDDLVVAPPAGDLGATAAVRAGASRPGFRRPGWCRRGDVFFEAG
ncbi:hypothetical protein [Streptomyces sp. NPDC058145]|uniref:hypothetical protein n=1 Tax=Streptomyces sp. NPDC058145 TaxID=3346356 RepID=UPI0036E67FC2